MATSDDLSGSVQPLREGLPPAEKFLVAFSFAGQERSLIRPVAEALGDLLGRSRIFYDDWHLPYLAGESADRKLQEIYKDRSVLVISGISRNYGSREYPLTELLAIDALRKRARADVDETSQLRWLPLRVGEGDVPGIPAETTHAPDIRKLTTLAVTNLVIDRLGLINPTHVANVVKQAEPPPIFLAEPASDLERQHTRLRELILSAGWPVITPKDYPSDVLPLYEQRIEADLRGSHAYVQLIGAEPCARGGYDRIQFETASRIGLKRFCHRNSAIDLDSIQDAVHRDFLGQADVVSGFDDFKRHIDTELGILRAGLKKTPTAAIRLPGETSALVRVVVRSRDRATLWKEIFEWFDQYPCILPDLMSDEDNLVDMNASEPCHGFLLACDGSSNPQFNRSYIEQCRQIQLREKDSDRQPPVGVIYWPPPEVEWSEILHAKAAKMSRATRAQWEGLLKGFVEEVRRVVTH